jgi:hypothetical protein
MTNIVGNETPENQKSFVRRHKGSIIFLVLYLGRLGLHKIHESWYPSEWACSSR